MKCSYTSCSKEALHKLRPDFLDIHYCEFHFNVIKAWAHNGFGGNFKKFSNIEQLNFVRLLVEGNPGFVGDWYALYKLFLDSYPDYFGPLRDSVFFRNCLTKLDIPCVSNMDVNNGLLYCCSNPCLFMSEAHNKTLKK